MFNKTEISEQNNQHEQLKIREKIEIVLRKLQTLKNESSELISQCQELKKLRSEHKGKVCSKCGYAIESGHEITFRDSAGTQTCYYHKECFEQLLIS
ncbi:MAG: hypothetical protein OEZ21_07525 [Candidatus Bathyarchaeota archaeon]|jgi:NADH pyrophosphatase NudC (nudix superfamily)|nr:hypothetical protein [Candidatus Bathyarchaeota archaeon]MDH5746785.1 hypothetical protein [Candidatus Bathyarchaeota archaeon]